MYDIPIIARIVIAGIVSIFGIVLSLFIQSVHWEWFAVGSFGYQIVDYLIAWKRGLYN